MTTEAGRNQSGTPYIEYDISAPDTLANFFDHYVALKNVRSTEQIANSSPTVTEYQIGLMNALALRGRLNLTDAASDLNRNEHPFDTAKYHDACAAIIKAFGLEIRQES